MTSADMIGKRCTTCAIMFTDETAFVSITELYKARITNDDILQSRKLIMAERLLARFANCFGPVLVLSDSLNDDDLPVVTRPNGRTLPRYLNPSD